MQIKTFHKALSEPVDAASLGFFRIAFGAILFIEVCRFFEKGWVKQYFITPQFFFSYPGLEWIRPWPGNGMYWHFAFMGVAALLLMLGIGSRIAAAALCLSFTYMFLIDRTHYLNHFYLICLLAFQFSVVDADRAFAILPQAGPRSCIPRWQLLWPQFQLAVVYFFGGLAKLSPDWLAGEPMRLWLSASALAPGWKTNWLAYTLSYGGLVLDLFAVPLLLWRRSRMPAAALLAGFHLFNAYFFRIGVFPWLMLLATPLFLSQTGPDAFSRKNTARHRWSRLRER